MITKMKAGPGLLNEAIRRTTDHISDVKSGKYWFSTGHKNNGHIGKRTYLDGERRRLKELQSMQFWVGGVS